MAKLLSRKEQSERSDKDQRNQILWGVRLNRNRCQIFDLPAVGKSV
jgi:hypothetical protein